MRLLILAGLCLCLLAPAGFAELPVLSFPATMEVVGNGLHAMAFVVDLGGISEEVERGLRYSFEGFPPFNPPQYDETSKLFFWGPTATQEGSYTFTMIAKDPTGQRTSRSINVSVLTAPTLEALPQGWDDMKKEDKYLIGKRYYPSANILEVDIGALPEYQIEVLVRNSFNQDCLLIYLPGEGRAKVNKTRLTAEIRLGGKYASEYVRKVRRDLYEDLYAHFGMIFNHIVSVRVTGGFALQRFRILDRPALISAFGLDDIYLPVINLSFDDRFYSETLFSLQDPMLISDSPIIKVDFNTSSGLIWRRTRLFIDDTEYHAARNSFTSLVVKPHREASTFDVDYAMYMLRIPVEKKLPFGEHHLVLEVQNAFGLTVSREAYARVVSIPAQVQGKPVVFPSPFNPERDGEVKIQYRLSMSANIEIAIFGVDGSTKMKKRIFMGEEGARKGLNTISWDGSTAGGMPAANGIYTGVIIDKDENRILEKFKMTVYR
jgi:hypothetical protein